MWKKIVILLMLSTMCLGQSNYNVSFNKRKPHYDPYYHLLYGGGILYYLTFILIKIKIAFVIGTIITAVIVAGKVFALIKYAELMKSKEHHEPEKIYMQAPSYSHDHGPPLYSGPLKSYSSPYMSPHSSGVTVDKLPPNAEIAGGGGPYYDAPPPNGYGRHYANSDTLYEYYIIFKKMLQKINITEMAFKRMKLKSNECKRKFVCVTDYSSKYSYILSMALKLFRDKNYDRYKPRATISSLEDCQSLFPACNEVNIT